MALKTYSVTLDDMEVVKAQGNYGVKLSPLLNKLLSDWNEKNKKDDSKNTPKTKSKSEDELDDDFDIEKETKIEV